MSTLATRPGTDLPPSLTAADITVGQQLPELVIDVSTRTIVSTALASRDYQDVHHDRDLAVQRGSKDIFMNILSSNGFALRYVTDWAGPEAIVVTSKIRLGVPNYAGEQMVVRGEVTGVEPRHDQIRGGVARGDEALVTVAVRGTNSLGDHLVGTVGITVPAAASSGATR